jgi:spore maturation protein CgeB
MVTQGEGWPGGTKLDLTSYVNAISESKCVISFPESSRSAGSQLKGRDFEVPACRSVLVRATDSGFERFFEPGREFLCYRSPGDLAAQLDYYRGRPELLQEIADSGYRRVRAEHNMVDRLTELLARTGRLSADAPTAGRDGKDQKL